MKGVTLVTGPLRSGTSCVTGLLECCGFDMGKNLRVLREPSEYNPKGHFETDLLYAINHRLLVETDRTLWSIIEPPEESALAEIAAKREHYFRLFLRKFDGELCKDPLMCLTLPFWEPYWPELQRIVFCLRHPLAVAQSVIKRYWVPLELGFELWRTYVTRFFNADRRKKVFIFDFDAFRRSPKTMLITLLNWLDRSVAEQDIQHCLGSFFHDDYIHWPPENIKNKDIPIHINALYQEIHSRAGAWR